MFPTYKREYEIQRLGWQNYLFVAWRVFGVHKERNIRNCSARRGSCCYSAVRGFFILTDLMSSLCFVCVCGGDNIWFADKQWALLHNMTLRMFGGWKHISWSKTHREKESYAQNTKVSESKSSVLACRLRDKIKNVEKIVQGGREKLVPLLTFDQVWWRSGPQIRREKHETDIKTRLNFFTIICIIK